MAKSDYTYCGGKRCLLRKNCKRYLEGQGINFDEGTDFIDNCEEDERPLFEPAIKSE